MDINKLFIQGNIACGRVLKILPESDIGSPKQYMARILKNVTLPSLNELHPCLYRTSVRTDQLIKLPDDSKRLDLVGYRIPIDITRGQRIMGIKHCYPTSSSKITDDNTVIHSRNYMTGLWSGAYPNKYGRTSSANLYESVLSANIMYADMQLLGQLKESPVTRFEAPNIIWITKSYENCGSLDITFRLENDDNLISIPDSAFEAVKRLFILDLKSSIYSEYGILSTLETPYGTIDLKIEDWSGCSDQRSELYDTYMSTAHLRKHGMFSG